MESGADHPTPCCLPSSACPALAAAPGRRHWAPRAPSTAGMVLRQMRTSFQSDHSSMYWRSSSIQRSKSISLRPLICQMQVMPGFMERRRRAHHAHLAAKHVPELGELVEGGAAEQATHPRDARVVPHLEDRPGHLVVAPERRQPGLGVHVHAAELEDVEEP